MPDATDRPPATAIDAALVTMRDAATMILQLRAENATLRRQLDARTATDALTGSCGEMSTVIGEGDE